MGVNILECCFLGVVVQQLPMLGAVFSPDSFFCFYLYICIIIVIFANKYKLRMSIWNNKVKRILKSELVKRGLSTEDLTTLLNENGCTETKSSVDSKISRGTFSASFFMQSLFVIGCTKIEIEEYRSVFTILEPSNLMVAEPNTKFQTAKDEK